MKHLSYVGIHSIFHNCSVVEIQVQHESCTIDFEDNLCISIVVIKESINGKAEKKFKFQNVGKNITDVSMSNLVGKPCQICLVPLVPET